MPLEEVEVRPDVFHHRIGLEHKQVERDVDAVLVEDLEHAEDLRVFTLAIEMAEAVLPDAFSTPRKTRKSPRSSRIRTDSSMMLSGRALTAMAMPVTPASFRPARSAVKRRAWRTRACPDRPQALPVRRRSGRRIVRPDAAGRRLTTRPPPPMRENECERSDRWTKQSDDRAAAEMAEEKSTQKIATVSRQEIGANARLAVSCTQSTRLKGINVDFAALTAYLAELALNNNKPWFEEHRPAYERLRGDWLAFVGQVIAGIAQFDPAVAIVSPKDALFRINRDVRFSKDKRPYKTAFARPSAPRAAAATFPPITSTSPKQPSL